MRSADKVELEKRTDAFSESEDRKKIIASLPVTENRLQLEGISTAVLEGGTGSPIVLLHGPGENATWWMRIIPELVSTHHVIAPDLPGHGASVATGGSLDARQVIPWLEALIEHTCSSPTILVGHVLGGSIAARFVIEHGDRIDRLVLVDSLGLGKFRPSLRFAFGLLRFMIRPTDKNYNRFLSHCMYDPDALSKQMGDLWEPFLAYNLHNARDPDRKSAMQTLMKKLGVPRIPSGELEKIKAPTTLIWGRNDKASELPTN